MEEKCIDCKRVVQIGLRGTGYGPEDWFYGLSRVSVLQCFHGNLVPEEIFKALSTKFKSKVELLY